MNWIYITGRGHSGTTFLDVVLGNHKNIQSYGEIISAINRHDDLCGCGFAMKNCPFWGKVIEEYNIQNNNQWFQDFDLLKKHTHVKKWPRLFLYGNYGKAHLNISKINQKLYTILKTNGEAEWILDSTKEPTRGLFLLSESENSRLIHMVRNPYGVANSYKNRFKKHGYFYFLRKKYQFNSLFWFLCIPIGISWTLGNLLIELSRLKKHNNNILRVKHENLTQKFPDTLEQISRFLGLDFTDVVEMHNKHVEFMVYHNIGGNSIKNKGGLVLNTKKTKITLSFLERAVIYITTIPLRWIYGYK